MNFAELRYSVCYGYVASLSPASLTDLHDPRTGTYSLAASYFVVFEHSNEFIDEVNKMSS
jgi:hypothetical protein